MESFVLDLAREEVTPKLNQFGGEPEASSTQLLIEVVDYVTRSLEDNRAGVVYSSIDFSKAFNMLDHTGCLRAFEKRGMSIQTMSLIGAFLTGPTMSVKVGNVRSKKRNVNAGALQGSMLGCYIFNIAIDDLEEGFFPTGLPNPPQKLSSLTPIIRPHLPLPESLPRTTTHCLSHPSR